MAIPSDDEMIRSLHPIATCLLLQTLLDVRDKSAGQVLRGFEIIVHLSLGLMNVAQEVVELSRLRCQQGQISSSIR